MTDSSLNIVDLIENNPITKLSNTYKSNFLNKIKERFTDQEQQMFVASFYCYLNYNTREDFVIDLDNVWKWLGFSQKVKAKHLLEKCFLIDIDYKLSLSLQVKRTAHTKGGHNKETFLLSVRTFKSFCLKAGTNKAEQIHEYYINLEDILQEIMQEESNELKIQLQKQVILSEQEKEKVREKTLIEQFPSNTQCVYYGFIDNLSDNKERLVKFGNSNNLKCRVYTHKKTYLNFRLVNAFKVDNKLQIETAIKNHILFKERQRTITLNSKKYVELLNIDDLTLDELDKSIKEIIKGIEYSPENYVKLLQENSELKDKLEKSNEAINNEKVYILQTDNDRLKLENLKLIKRYKALSKKTKDNIDDDIVFGVLPPHPHFIDGSVCGRKEMGDEGGIHDELHIITTTEMKDYGNVIPSLKKNIKNKTGTYDIGGKNYAKLEGTRQEVWDGIAHQTSGALLKHELIINKNGEIVSKRKSMAETHLKRLVQSGVNKPSKLITQKFVTECDSTLPLHPWK